jgi:predicted nucleic acid-binding protein
MYVIDSSGWVEYLTDGPLAGHYVRYLADLSKLVTPTTVLFETYRILMRRWSQDVAYLAVAEMGYTRVVSLDSATGIAAADFSLEYGLATADAFVYAAARLNGCELVTSDADFRGLPGVTLIEAGASVSPAQGG